MRAAKARANSSARPEFGVRTVPLSAHLCGCAGVRQGREPLEAARADHDPMLIGAEDVTAVKRARVMAPKALAR
jgi:hypothetical protein